MKTRKSVFVAIAVGMLIAHRSQAEQAELAETNTPHARLIEALIQVESNGRDNAIGDKHLKEMAYGCLQIRKPCLDDVNRRHGTAIKPEELIGNRSLSVWVCAKYLELYGTSKRLAREPSEEDLARIWNGGPNGWKKEATATYWSKVKKVLERKTPGKET